MESSEPNIALPLAAISSLQRGNKIEAIKIVRKELGADLKSAKDAVEQYLQAHPALQANINQMKPPIGTKILWSLLGIALGAILAYFFRAK